MFTLQQAIELATKAHESQWRKPTIAKPHYILESGDEAYKQDDIIFIIKPYITHPLAVMNMMTTEEEKIVAVLHDILEETHITFDTLESVGVSKNCLEALNVLTHTRNEDYSQYISKICLNKLATKVKLADMFHNMSDNPSETAKQKYLKAIPILLRNL